MASESSTSLKQPPASAAERSVSHDVVQYHGNSTTTALSPHYEPSSEGVKNSSKWAQASIPVMNGALEGTFNMLLSRLSVMDSEGSIQETEMKALLKTWDEFEVRLRGFEMARRSKHTQQSAKTDTENKFKSTESPGIGKISNQLQQMKIEKGKSSEGRVSEKNTKVIVSPGTGTHEKTKHIASGSKFTPAPNSHVQVNLDRMTSGRFGKESSSSAAARNKSPASLPASSLLPTSSANAKSNRKLPIKKSANHAGEGGKIVKSSEVIKGRVHSGVANALDVVGGGNQSKDPEKVKVRGRGGVRPVTLDG